MMMPSDPTPHLVMIHSDFAFGLFENGFNRPSHSADSYELVQRSIDRSIAEKVFDFRRILQIAANDQPELTSRQAAARFSHTQKCEITNKGTLAAFFDHGADPILLLNLLHQLLDWNGMLPGITQTQTSRMTPMTTPGGNMHFRRSTPDQGVLLNGGEIVLSGSRHTVSKRRTVSVQGICRYPKKRQITAFE